MYVRATAADAGAPRPGMFRLLDTQAPVESILKRRIVPSGVTNAIERMCSAASGSGSGNAASEITQPPT